jgi:energy-coupling factor transporter ATP-binding protein EcfA2
MGLNTMFLDEPISGFDETGQANLPDMLTKVDAMCRRAGKQIVLITHHSQLMHLGHPLRIG